MPMRVSNAPYLRSFQYQVLNSILYANKLLCKIGYVSDPNCSFCQQTIETIPHILLNCSFVISFSKEVYGQILNKLKSCESFTPEYRDIILGLSKETIDLLNYILTLGKSYLWTCRCNRMKPCLSHFKRILINKYQTERYISLKLNNSNLFKRKWKMLEGTNLVQLSGAYLFTCSVQQFILIFITSYNLPSVSK